MGIKAFILAHRNDDTRTLALQASKHLDVDMAFAIDQIRGWQKAKSKLPSWASCDDITYPPPLAMEQCSSEQTARYKADLCQKFIGDNERHILADLTGGAGVDFSFLAPLFTQAIYIERQDTLCQVARHNLRALGLDHAEVREGDAIALLDSLPHLSLLFIDPARRDQHGARTFAISDCTPDILPVLPRLLEKADHLMVKLSPMLDWHETLKSLDNACPNTVREIHIVAAANECKELLVWLSAHHSSSTNTVVCCANDQQTFITDLETERQAAPTPCISEIPLAPTRTIDPASPIGSTCWLYEPNAAIMKAGCFATLAERFSLQAIAPNSHLFLSTQHIPHFPGRVMHITGTTTMNKRQLRESLKDITQANITTRNFPLTADQLRKRLRLSDGGDTYLFATTTKDKQHMIFICKKGL
ncbi:MAG: SAM-dependent methyltransferase [Prevotella sp.]|nr:SAM-dependent methyltransferase [Prevotella sp.]